MMFWMPWMLPGSPDTELGAEQFAAARTALIARFDTNGDGSISAEELAADQAAMVSTLDTDGNGSISREEMQAAMPRPPRPPRGHRPPPSEGASGWTTGEFNGNGQPAAPAIDEDAKAAIQKAKLELREATASGDKTRIQAARKAFREAREAAFGGGKPGGW
jgi:hypothetical protein